ncbi:PIN domain-containing protein [Pseudomonas putida]
MIFLDTNVLSETLRRAPHEQVLEWLSRQPRAAVFTTTVTKAELLYGATALPDGQRKLSLLAAISGIFNEDFAGRVMCFDGDAADAYAQICAKRKAQGKPISQFDAMVAAIAKSRGASLATRNVKDFVGCDIEVIDPWGI